MPSCIGVSPEGTVRYWPSIGQEGVYVDVSAELAGQECERLGDYTRAGLVLATTTCTVVLLHPAVIGKQLLSPVLIAYGLRCYSDNVDSISSHRPVRLGRY